MRIDAIELERFRGATTKTIVQLDPKHRAVLLFGENGAGKSTLVDAIDAVCNGVAGSLKDRSSTDPRQHIPSIGHAPADWRVTLRSADQEWTASWGKSSISVAGQAPRPVARVLRRKDLLTLVEAAPSARFEALRTFIEVRLVEQSEANLGTAVKEARAAGERAVVRLESAQRTLTSLWEAEGSPGESAIAWAEARLKEDLAELEARSELVGGAERAINRLRDADVRLSQTTAQHQAAAAVHSTALSDLESLRAIEEDRQEGLIAVLKSAQAYIQPPAAPAACPICTQPVEAESLRATIAARLAEMNSFAEVLETEKVARAASTQAGAFFTQAQGAQETARTEAIEALSVVWPEDDRWQAGAGTETILSALTEIAAESKAVSEKVSQRNAIRAQYGAYAEAHTETGAAQRTQTALQLALEVCRTERHTFTAEVLAEVAAESSRLYQKLHPGEAIGLSGFRLDPSTKGSVHQEAFFETAEGIPPQAYFSESHLDTLGFCVWLAVVKRLDQGKCIVVLDDLFTSADGPHLQNVIDLLSEEAANFEQVIITTHYRLWRDKYRYAQGSKVELIELGRWSRTSGVRVGKTPVATDELANLLGQVPLDRQAIAAKAGVLLEAVLDHVTLDYRCSLPRNAAGEYTLDALLGGVTKLMGKLEAWHSDETGAETKADAAKPYTALRSLAFIRNQVGAHFNALGADVPDSEVESLGANTVELVNALRCAECGRLPRKRPGPRMTCTCKKTRWEPLELPK